MRRGVQRLKQLGVRSIAVMYLFSFVNPEHERRTREIVLEEFPDVEHISLSHEVMPRGPEFERVSTTLVNAYVAPRIAHYTSHLQDELRRAGYGGPLLIMQSTGGVMPPDYVARRAVTLLASGPTGGVMGATLAANRADAGDFVAVDMGGTSFDICLVRHGQPQIKTDWNWRYRYYIGLPMVDVQSVGAGGGSIARVRQGALLVGPESAGSHAGPGVLRPRRRAADGHRRRRGARLPPRRRASRAAACNSTSARPRRAIRNHVAEPLGLDVTRGGVGHPAHRQRQHGQRDPQGARGPRRRRARPVADRLRRQRRGARVRDRARARRRPDLRAEGRARVLGARRARRRLRRRSRPLVRHAAVAGRPRPRARAHDASSTARSPRSSSRPASTRPRPSRRSTCRCVTRARTST